MDTYLLLRSNKQSGPYSLQQLVSFGLKPYDLVWVEGKSAAWRYPSEVDGLKTYAPATEEQPYDRFYKKTEEKPEQKPQEKVVNQPVQKHEETIIEQEEIYSLPIESKTLTTSKKVFVSMPGGSVPKKTVQAVQVKAPAIVEQKPKIVEEKKVEIKPAFLPEPSLAPVAKEKPVSVNPVLLKEEPTLNEKYSESLDDIKRRYTETYLSRKQRSRWTSTHTSILQVVGGAVFFCFLVVVAYKNFAGEENTQPRTTVIKPDKRAINTSTVSTTPSIIPPVVTETKKQSGKKTQTTNESQNPADESLAVNKTTTKQSPDQIVKENEIAAGENDTDEKAKAVMVKTAETDESKIEEVKSKPRRVNISRLVNVRANNYKQRAFGGVMNLELTVNNDSKFELDKVVVELQYLKPSEQPIKTERIVFNSVAPNDSKTIKIPDYLRGVKVSYRVTDIESSQYERQTAGL